MNDVDDPDQPRLLVRVLRLALATSLVLFFGGCGATAIVAGLDPGGQSPAGQLVVPIVTSLLFLVLGLGAALWTITNPTAPKATISERVETLSASLRDSAQLIEEITAEMAAQQAALDRIRTEQRHAEGLAAASKAEAQAVQAVVDATVRRAENQAGRYRRRRDLINLGIGAVIGVATGVTGNFVYSFLA